MTGTYPSQNDQHHPFNARTLTILTVLILFFAATFSYFLFNATDVIELASIFFQCISAIGLFANFSVHFWKTAPALDLIGKFEAFIEMSKIQKNKNKIWL